MFGDEFHRDGCRIGGLGEEVEDVERAGDVEELEAGEEGDEEAQSWLGDFCVGHLWGGLGIEGSGWSGGGTVVKWLSIARVWLCCRVCRLRSVLTDGRCRGLGLGSFAGSKEDDGL